LARITDSDTHFLGSRAMESRTRAALNCAF
jgi:hypothetical protein